MTWVELFGEHARDNAQGGMEDGWEPDPTNPVRVFGWNGEDYPRMTVSAYVIRGAVYNSTGDSYPHRAAMSFSQKLSDKDWWTGVSGPDTNSIPIEFLDIALELLKQAVEAFKALNVPPVPAVPEFWKKRLNYDDDAED